VRAGPDVLSSRRALAQRIERELGPFDPAHLDAIARVDRARFVRPGDEPRSCDDVPLALDDEGLATISAPHAYLLSYRLLELARGDRLVELGSGSGYGAALAADIVGDDGRVATFEIDPYLAARARELLAEVPNVVVHEGDALASAPMWEGATRIVCTFAVAEVPALWLAALGEGDVLVAPVGPAERDQKLLRIARADGEIRTTSHGAVRYVRNRSLA
jgi:protein-L-isoaspartate(D-aspartate) O-methyltransferase